MRHWVVSATCAALWTLCAVVNGVAMYFNHNWFYIVLIILNLLCAVLFALEAKQRRREEKNEKCEDVETPEETLAS